MTKKKVYGIEYDFVKGEPKKTIASLGQETLLHLFQEMLLIRHFEMRAESAYQHGHVGGFFHAYTGQEAIQLAAVAALGREKHWWATTYRCHALALLLGASPNELMAELYGKVTGNALGRGGSMHFFAKRLLGGLAIVGGHVPIATGAAFSLKYQAQEGVAVCFLGEGAVAQGAVHESLNLAALWNLPCIYVIENNHWGMGTAAERAFCTQPIAEHMGRTYQIPTFTLDGTDFFSCYHGFSLAYEACKKSKKPILIEAITERFRGHSISDPALYRTKEELEEAKKQDPILLLKEMLKKEKILTDSLYEEIDKEQKKKVVEAMEYAEKSPYPEESSLEEDVFAP
ncbi:MAG: pyruvate dehydrogenase (acetyl-transferring) E1 component subunit alpha [Simkania negevensis]|nr:pyruvate dehydrogenase (acetyl-transferring) E1 component subunit alpha [Simkania negevensis]